jgi:hypothetical protein
LGEQESRASRPGRWWRSLDTWQQLAGIVGTLTGVVALLLALGLIQPFEESDSSDGGRRGAATGEIDRFEGVAGHLAESRALLDFLDQHDDETVYLDVGFPELATGPAGGDNVGVETFPAEGGGTLYVPAQITLMTECESGAPPPEENPTVADGCQGTSLTLDGPVNEDSFGTFEHGVPVIQGHFLVDITGGLYMGVTPILLRPLTFAQATGA